MQEVERRPTSSGDSLSSVYLGRRRQRFAGVGVSPQGDEEVGGAGGGKSRLCNSNFVGICQLLSVGLHASF